MKDILDFKVLYFNDPEPEPEPETTLIPNTNVSTDLNPAKSIDHINRLVAGIKTLQKVLGITRMNSMAAGTQIKRYKKEVTMAADQVAEGELIGLSKVTRTPLNPIVLTLKKFLRLTTAEAIQKVGSDMAIEEMDDEILKEVQKGVRNDFFTALTAAGSTSATAGATLQAALANVCASLAVYFEDKEVKPVFFVNPIDVYTQLGNATISTQDAFGWQYIENFLGIGNAVLTPRITQGHVYATVEENLNGAYIPQSGDVANAFDLTYDESGMVGMTHSRADDRASINTLLLTGVVFYTEDQSGVIHGQISGD